MPQMVWKFVDQPIATPATLFDMNNWSAGCVVDMGQTFDISPPVLRKTKVANNLSDGSLNTAASFENRNLVFSVGIGPGTKAWKSSLLNNLMSELYKPKNLLMYQMDSTRPPVFFRTFRSDDVKVVTRGSGVDEIWRIDLNVEAEPFAIGPRIDIPQFVVSNDPAAATNPMRFDITGIVGDVPTPAFVRISDLGPQGKALLATRTFGNPTSLTLSQQAESATLGTDATVAADAAASNGSRVNISFSTNAAMTTRLTMTQPNGTDPVALRGRYRVFARITALTAAINVTLRWRQTGGGDYVPGPLNTTDLTPPNWEMLDLGVLEFPAPQMAPEQMGYSNLPTQHANTDIQIQAARNSGSGTLLIDYLFLMPATERFCALFQWAAVPSGWMVLDGPNDATYGLAAGSTPFGATRIIDNKQGIITRQGGLPMLVPGLTNRWWFSHNESANGITETVDISYWPRWKEVATA